MQPKIEILGDVNTCIPWIPWAKKQWDLRDGRWLKKVNNITIEFFRTNSVGFIRFFTQDFPISFSTHPRSNHYVDGVNYSKLNEQTNRYAELDNNHSIFPLIDDDHGTLLVSVSKNGDISSEVPASDNYGVNHWSEDGTSLGWRGWPAITLGCSRSTSVDGVTELEISTAYNTFYTPLSGKLYSEGVANQTPGRVRGASISKFGTAIITTVNYTEYNGNGDSVNSPNPIGINWLYDNAATTIPEELQPGKVGGYFDEMYVNATGDFYVDGRVVRSLDGWVRIGFTISNITNLPTWASADGITFTGDDGTWSFGFAAVSTVNGEYPEVVMPNGSTARPIGTFTSYFVPRAAEQNKYLVKPGRTLSSNLADPDHQDSVGSMWSKSSDLLWNICHMQTASANLFMKYSVGGQRHIGTDNANSLVPVKYQTRPDPVNYYIDVFFSGIVGQPILFTPLNFKSGPYVWDGDVDVAEDTASATISYADYAANCGTKTITVTDACGFSASVEVRMKTGYWCAVTQSGFQCKKGAGCNGTDVPCNGCCGLVRGYWYGDRPDDTDLTATSYMENKYLEGVWCFLRPGAIVCTLTRKWVCSTSVCDPLPPVDCS